MTNLAIPLNHGCNMKAHCWSGCGISCSRGACIMALIECMVLVFDCTGSMNNRSTFNGQVAMLFLLVLSSFKIKAPSPNWKLSRQRCCDHVKSWTKAQNTEVQKFGMPTEKVKNFFQSLWCQRRDTHQIFHLSWRIQLSNWLDLSTGVKILVAGTNTCISFPEAGVIWRAASRSIWTLLTRLTIAGNRRRPSS